MTALAFKVDSPPSLFEADFAQHAAALPGAGLPWLDARRRAAIDAFAKTGIPNRRVEAWKYTDLANALESDLEPVSGIADSGDVINPFGIAAGAEIVLNHGFLRHVSNAGGLDIVNLSALDEQTPGWVRDHLGISAAGGDQPLGAVSLALMRGGVALRVQGEQSLSLQFANPVLDRDAVSHTRALILLEEGASLRLLESHSGETRGQRLANIGIEFVLKSGAKLEHVRLQAEDTNTLHVSSIGASLGRDAEYRALYAAMGARLSRVDINVKLAAEGAHATLHNIAVLNGGIADITTVMDHAAPHTTSRQLFKSVVGGRGRSVNQGRVSVRKGALKSDSHQLFKALLLSPRAEADAKPELEIFADDVICGHGTAIGALDADALFYLRTRGIPEDEAKGLLIRAFLEDAIEGFADQAVHDVLASRVDAALASLGQVEVMNDAKPINGYDVEALRRDFPILARKVHGRPLVYLDNAASAQKPKAVIGAMTEFLTSEYANVHRGVHYLSGAATERYEEARRRIQRFLNAAHEDEIIYTKGGTEAINLVAASYLGPRIEPGDEIVLSVMEHHSNIVPWHFLRERQGAVLKWVDVSDLGELDASDIARAITPRTKLVAISHMSNVLGTKTDLREVARLAHERGVPVLADGCQGAVHGTVDVQALDVDFYAITGHKLYGPTGIGALYAKRAHLKTMRPYQGGGEMIREVTRDKVTYADAPMRFEAGTPPIVQTVGLAAALDYLDGIGRDRIAAHEMELARVAARKLKDTNGVRIIGEAQDKGPIISFEAIGIHAHDLATILDREGVAVRGGHHCAQPLMERFNVAGTARASFALYNTMDEVDALIAAVGEARKVFG